MKKLLVVLLSLLCVLTLAGCSSNNNQAPAETPAAAPSTDNKPAETKPSTGNQNTNMISMDEAKAIAYKEAGVDESDVTYSYAKLDKDDGKDVYEVEFYAGNKEYDYDIDPYTGAVLSFDSEVENLETPVFAGDEMSLEDAKQIALDEAGVKESDVTMKEAYPKIENGNKHYKFEFIHGETEYEVEVDAISGTVVDFEKDSIYD